MLKGVKVVCILAQPFLKVVLKVVCILAQPVLKVVLKVVCILAQPFLKVVYMNISTNAEAFVPLLKQYKLISKRENDDKYKLIMRSLFKDLLEAEKYLRTLPVNKTTYTWEEHKDNNHVQLSNNSRFFPKTIRKYIQDTQCSLIKYTCEIQGRENNIYFYIYASEAGASEAGASEAGASKAGASEASPTSKAGASEHGINRAVKLMFTWLYVCIKYAQQKCAKELNVYIFLTPFKKTLPVKTTTIISSEHVNTAFTYSCLPDGEITIFRAEEWFKVFLHETFHAYNLDFGLTTVPTNLQDKINTLFHINSDFNINEAYTEAWSRIINCVLYSFESLTEREKTFNNFLMYTDFCLELERLFSLYQMNKILNFMGLNYPDIYSSGGYLKAHLYKEDTHVFGYYILTALFLNDYKEFVQWCAAINTNILKFNCSAESFKKMAIYIQQIYNNPELLRVLSLYQTNKIKTTANLASTTRMTVIDLVDIQ